MSQSG
jgi:hypothetical protein